MKVSPQSNIDESHSWRLVKRKALRELLNHILSSGLYLFTWFLMTKNWSAQRKIGQAKNRISKGCRIGVPGITTINASYPYVRHAWLYGFFDTIHKTIQKLKGDHNWSLFDHVAQQLYRSCHWSSTKKILCCFGYHVQDHRHLWPIQDHKTFFAQPQFWLKIAFL